MNLDSCNVEFFCFQAEDGIRDLTVTGVQKCALPISGRLFDLRLAREYLGKPYRAACAGAAGRVAAAAAGDDRAARGRARTLRRGAPQRVAGRDRSVEGKSSPDSVHR